MVAAFGVDGEPDQVAAYSSRPTDQHTRALAFVTVVDGCPLGVTVKHHSHLHLTVERTCVRMVLPVDKVGFEGELW